jgi:hypothetical protein
MWSQASSSEEGPQQQGRRGSGSEQGPQYQGRPSIFEQRMNQHPCEEISNEEGPKPTRFGVKHVAPGYLKHLICTFLEFVNATHRMILCSMYVGGAC